MKRLLLTFVIAGIAFTSFAQEFEIPAGYSFKQKGDYEKYQSEVLKAIQWLQDTPLKANPEKIKDVNAFVLQWLTGTSAVSIEIKQEIVTFMKPNADLLMIFMGGWSRHALETGEKDKVAGTLKGLEAVMDFYTKNRSDLKRDKNVEKYIDMKNSGKLEEYVRKNA